MKKQIVLGILTLALLASAVMIAIAEEDESEQELPMSIPDSLPGPSSLPMPSVPASAPAMAPFPSPIIITNFDVTYTYGKPDNLVEALLVFCNH